VVQNQIETGRLFGEYVCSFCVHDSSTIFKTEKKLYDHYQSEPHCTLNAIICTVCQEISGTWSGFILHLITRHLIVQYHLG
jgi:hypothetical protein